MSNNNFCKKVIYPLLLLFFFLGGRSVSAFILTSSGDNGNVGISAKVGEEVVVTPGGGNVGGFILPKTAVRFSGEAYPNASVSLLKQGEVKAVTKANSAGDFNIMLEEQYNSTILYSLFAQDISGNRSILINYPIVVQTGFITYLSGIRFAPTIVADKVEVRFGSYLTVTGYAFPAKEMQTVVEGEQSRTFTLTSNTDGSYKIIIPLLDLPKGNYLVYVKYVDNNRISKLINFSIGETDMLNTDTLVNIPGDCNADRMISLIDFSVLAFWYGGANPPACVDTNRDAKINLVDFSILAFWWTG